MNYFPIFLVLSFLTLSSCKNVEKEEDTNSKLADSLAGYDSYGDDISSETIFTAAGMETKYQNLKVGDTLNTNFRATVTTVCKKKGCWMNLELPHNKEEVMVKFKDYGFFVPKDIEGKEVIVSGKAFVTEVSVEEQKHYAEDKGSPEEEIDAIIHSKRTLSFIADGVLIKK